MQKKLDRFKAVRLQQNIAIVVDGFLIPQLYVLMADKSTALYRSMFSDLKNKCQQHGLLFNPATIMSDFESGLIPAVRQEFPNVQHKGCHFHMCQVIMVYYLLSLLFMLHKFY